MVNLSKATGARGSWAELEARVPMTHATALASWKESFQTFCDFYFNFKKEENAVLYDRESPERGDLLVHRLIVSRLLASSAELEIWLGAVSFGEETPEIANLKEELATITGELREALELWHPAHPCDYTELREALS